MMSKLYVHYELHFIRVLSHNPESLLEIIHNSISILWILLFVLAPNSDIALNQKFKGLNTWMFLYQVENKIEVMVIQKSDFLTY